MEVQSVTLYGKVRNEVDEYQRSFRRLRVRDRALMSGSSKGEVVVKGMSKSRLPRRGDHYRATRLHNKRVYSTIIIMLFFSSIWKFRKKSEAIRLM